MTNRLTPFGLACREHRLRRELVMADQAKEQKCSVAFISAIERGQRTIPDDFPDQFSQWLELDTNEAQRLRNLASEEKKIIKVLPSNRERALLADDFARRINDLSTEKIDKFRELLAAGNRYGKR